MGSIEIYGHVDMCVCVRDSMCGVYMECWKNVCVCEEIYICGYGGLHVYRYVSGGMSEKSPYAWG